MACVFMVGVPNTDATLLLSNIEGHHLEDGFTYISQQFLKSYTDYFKKELDYGKLFNN